MRVIIVTISLFCFQCVYFSQTSTERTEVSSGGGDATTSSGDNYSYNIGGNIVATEQGSSVTITQGFEQPLPEDGTIFSEVFVPNAFSPDGDGVNETFIITLPSNLINVVDVKILNRWGDEVAFVEDYNNLDHVWYGTNTNTGDLVVAGTYFYILEDENSGQKMSGWVQVIR